MIILTGAAHSMPLVPTAKRVRIALLVNSMVTVMEWKILDDEKKLRDEKKF